MTLDKLILKDFLTYDNFEYEFEKRPLLVQGLNLTDDKQKTNGTGKSGMQTGIEFCITASNSRDVRDHELVTYGKKQATAELFASCNYRKETLHIDWTIKVKGSNQLVLKIRKYETEEWIPVKFSNINDGKKFIINWFAITKEDLFNYYIINKTRFKSFFKSSNKENVDLINRFSDASIIQGIENVDNDELDKTFTEAEKLINATEGKIELVNENILKEKGRNFQEELKEEIEDIEEEIEFIKEEKVAVDDKISKKKVEIGEVKKKITDKEGDIDVAKEDKIDIVEDLVKSEKIIAEAEEDLDEAQELINDFKSTDWKADKKYYEDEIDSTDSFIEKAEAKDEKMKVQETRLLKFIQDIEVKLGGIITCPSCEHEFLLEMKEGETIKALKKKKGDADGMKISLEKGYAANSAAIKILKEDKKEVEKSISAINEKESVENESKNKLSIALNKAKEKLTEKKGVLSQLKIESESCKTDIEGYNTDIVNLKKDIKNKKTEIENFSVKKTNFNTEIENYDLQINSLKVGDSKKIIKNLKRDLRSLETEIQEQRTQAIKIGDIIYEKNQWKNNFKQFRMFLANQSLEVIEYHCNRYLDDMGSDLRVKMEGFKVLANGTYKEQITAKIIRDRERTFASFSSGEQGRLLFASILANRHMINETHKYGGLDFLSIDEVFEGVDSIGLKHLIESAKTLNITVMIITHVTDEDTSSDRILIVKENGISKIKKE